MLEKLADYNWHEARKRRVLANIAYGLIWHAL